MILEADGLTKVYHGAAEDVAAVNNVSLQLHEGELVALMGPSGSGKTTLLSMLGCILQPSHGRLLICGETVVWNESVLPTYRRRYYGYIAQSFNLLSSLNVWENVQVPMLLSGVRGQSLAQRTESALESVSLKHRATYPVSVLSGGEKQRAAIARAIVTDTPIILGDEPTANLDGATTMQIISTLRDFVTQRGKSILVVTHDERYLPYLDRVYRMEDGELTPD